MSMPPNKFFFSPVKRQGFTLIELLVVLMIIAVMATASYEMLGTSMRLESRTQKHGQGLEQITRALHWLQQDAEQYIERPVRDELGEFEPSLWLTHGRLSLTRLGWANPLQEQRASVQRVTYQLVDGSLQRLSWRVLDRAQDSEPLRQTLMESVQGLEFALLSNSGWHEQWPVPLSLLPGASNDGFPVALRIRLTSTQFGTIERLFELPSSASKEVL